MPVYTIGTEQKRIGTLSVFRQGVEPKWEDPINFAGSEFRFTLTLPAEKSSWAFLNQLWEDFVVDLISRKMPHDDEIAGIRIVDKSRDTLVLRLEVWMKFNNADSDPRGDAIKNFVFTEYLKKHDITTSDALKFENHNKTH